MSLYTCWCCVHDAGVRRLILNDMTRTDHRQREYAFKACNREIHCLLYLYQLNSEGFKPGIGHGRTRTRSSATSPGTLTVEGVHIHKLYVAKVKGYYPPTNDRLLHPDQ